MTAKQGFDPFARKPAPAGKAASKATSTTSPEDLLFAGEESQTTPAERQPQATWSTAELMATSPAPSGATEPDEMEMVAGILAGSDAPPLPAAPKPAPVAPKPTAAATPKPRPEAVAQPAVKPVAVTPVAVKPVAVKPVAVKPVAVTPVAVTPQARPEATPASEPTKARTPGRVPSLVFLTIGAVGGLWFAFVKGDFTLGACVAAMGCGTAMIVRTFLRR
jgi:hypothetical protein